jgi:hypothetical protein
VVSNITNTNDTDVDATGLDIVVENSETLYIRYRNTSTISASGGSVGSTGTHRINSGSISGVFSAIFTWTAGSGDTDPSDSGNWNIGSPIPGADILVPTGAAPYPVFLADYEAGQVVLENDASLTMAAGTTLSFGNGKGASGDGRIILKSDVSGDARIGDLTDAGVVDVDVLQERFILGSNRAFRFMGHPFSHSLPLNVLAAHIDITGDGGAANGFTPTDTDNPSAFTFNPLSADGSETTEDTGWIAFSNLNTDQILQHQGIRILIRGPKGQAGSLLDIDYEPDPVTLEWEGTINQGLQVINLFGEDKGAADLSDWNLVGNPFP